MSYKIIYEKKSLNTKSREKNQVLRRIRRVAIAHITDLDIHSPIRPDQHVARGSFHHRIHHLCFIFLLEIQSIK
jgi:hypothetical protein